MSRSYEFTAIGTTIGRQLFRYVVQLPAWFHGLSGASSEHDNSAAVAVLPRPELMPFFETAPWQVADDMTLGRKRRGSVSSPRHAVDGTDPIDIAVLPPRRVSGNSKRTSYHAPRRRKLSSEQEAAIRSEAGNRTLRELAAAFGVSHETVRAVLRQEFPALGERR